MPKMGISDIGFVEVVSSSDPDMTYRVRWDGTCECRSYQYRGTCRHREEMFEKKRQAQVNIEGGVSDKEIERE